MSDGLQDQIEEIILDTTDDDGRPQAVLAAVRILALLPNCADCGDPLIDSVVCGSCGAGTALECAGHG